MPRFLQERLLEPNFEEGEGKEKTEGRARKEEVSSDALLPLPLHSALLVMRR